MVHTEIQQFDCQNPRINIGLDLSTVCTGIALFSDELGLIDYDVIQPEKFVGHSKAKYPEKSIKFSKSIAEQLKFHLDLLVCDFQINKIYIEEMNIKGKGSMVGNKSLSMMHGIVLYNLIEYLPNVEFITSSQWRVKHNIRMDVEDRDLNKLINSGQSELDLIDHKTLSVRFVNKTFDLSLEYEDNDIADAICVAMF